MIRDFKFAFRQLLKARIHDCSGDCAGPRNRREQRRFQFGEHVVFCAARLRASPRIGAGFFTGQNEPENLSRFLLSDLSATSGKQNSVFTDAMAYNLAMVGIGQKGDTRRAFAAIVSSNYFSVLGVLPAQGRAFLPEEETPGRARRSRSSATVTGRNTISPRARFAHY